VIDLSKFHVLTVVSNPVRYQSRYDLYDIFSEDIQRKGAQLWTVEMQTGSRRHQITKPGEPKHIQVHSSSIPGELWHKENLVNLGIAHISRQCPDWRYVAWVDADIKFEAGALEETVHALQHWDIVQMWSHAIDFGPEGETMQTHQGYMYCYWKGIELEAKNGYSKGGHPGFAYAIRRESLNRLGRIIDWGVLGSADRHMACALVGRVEDSVHGDCHPGYHRWLQIWQERAERHIKRNVGYVPGTIRHMWHGRKADRGYSSRWRILVRHQFNPDTDLKLDVSGVWQLVSETPRQLRLRDDIRKYFRARREDATTVD
jgi:hypothetical protein